MTEPFVVKPRRKKKIKEKDVEKSHVDKVESEDGASYKFVSPAHRSVPDRIDLKDVKHMAEFLEQLGVKPRQHGFLTMRELAIHLLSLAIKFTELKKPGEDATGPQKREHARLRALGFTVDVIDHFAGEIMSANLSTGDISDKLGFKLTAPFITDTLGVKETEKIKAGHYWDDAGYRQILFKLAERIRDLADGTPVPSAAGPKFRKGKKKDETPGQGAPVIDPFADTAMPATNPNANMVIDPFA